jgi:hypothetical protein
VLVATDQQFLIRINWAQFWCCPWNGGPNFRAEASELRNRFVCFFSWVMWICCLDMNLLLVLALDEGVLDLLAAVNRRDQD